MNYQFPPETGVECPYAAPTKLWAIKWHCTNTPLTMQLFQYTANLNLSGWLCVMWCAL